MFFGSTAPPAFFRPDPDLAPDEQDGDEYTRRVMGSEYLKEA